MCLQCATPFWNRLFQMRFWVGWKKAPKMWWVGCCLCFILSSNIVNYITSASLFLLNYNNKYVYVFIKKKIFFRNNYKHFNIMRWAALLNGQEMAKLESKFIHHHLSRLSSYYFYWKSRIFFYISWQKNPQISNTWPHAFDVLYNSMLLVQNWLTKFVLYYYTTSKTE